jgi:hypothetical protein
MIPTWVRCLAYPNCGSHGCLKPTDRVTQLPTLNKEDYTTVKTIKLTNILVPKEAGNFLNNRVAMSFSDRLCSVKLAPERIVMTTYA